MIIEIRDDFNQYLFSNIGKGNEKKYNDLILKAKPLSSYKLKKYFFQSDLKVEAFKNIDYISSVSGGSWAALSYKTISDININFIIEINYFA